MAFCLFSVSKGVVERKKWTKFGQSRRDQPGPNSATTVVGDDVQMQFLSNEELEVPEKNPLLSGIGEGKGFVRCRFCQDNHFSAKCPYKDSGLPADFLLPPKDLGLTMEDKKVKYISW
jgi:translation initiation factor 3 subunit G